MATTTKDFDTASAAARLHRLEEVVKSLDAPEGFDLTEFVESFNRLYRMTQKGATAFPDEPITYDLPDDEFLYEGMSSSLHQLILAEFIGDFELTSRPLVQRLLGGDETGTRTGTKSLLQLLLGSRVWGFETSSTSFAGKVLGNQDLVTELLEGPDAHASSVLGLLLWIINKQQSDYAYLKARIDAMGGV